MIGRDRFGSGPGHQGSRHPKINEGAVRQKKFDIVKNPGCLRLRDSKLLIQLVAVIRESEISSGALVSEVKQAAWVGRGCNWGSTLFVFAIAIAFGGVAGNWFDAQHAGGGMGFRILQLATGAVAMGAIVSIPGSLFFGRNPVRWGMGMPILVYIGGIILALIEGRSGVSGLIYGAPFLIGLAIAAGVTGAFFVDGIFVRQNSSR